jgi:hypothetical protein
VTTTTNSEGAFLFPAPPAESLPFGSTLVVFHERNEAGGLDLSADPLEWPADVRIVLEPVEPISVRVVDAHGARQAGATVRHAAQPRRRTPADDRPLARFEHFFQHEGVTNECGEVLLAPFHGDQAFWAEKGELVSVPWQGPRPSEVLLRLGESFTVGGTITMPDLKAWDPTYEGERRILVAGLTGTLWRPLARLRDVQAGEWGPLRIPLDGVARYRVRFEGLPIVPIEETFDPPRPSSHRRIDFHAQKEADLWFLVQDENEKPIPTARAVVWWDGALQPTTGKRVEGAARPDGTIYTGSFPPGRINYRVSAPGYVDFESSATVPGEGAQITLSRAGSVRGRCMHGGEPVSNFEVIFVREGDSRNYRSETFLDHEDGWFDIDGLGSGEWFLCATSPEFPSGKPTSVMVTVGQVTEVVVELPTAILGGGRIVDAKTGEPISSAFVQPYSSGGMERILPWGSPVSAATNGTFEIAAFVRGANYIVVRAEGYAEANKKATATDDEFLDFGEISLARPQTLDIELVGWEQLPYPPNAIHSMAVEEHELPDRSFESNGTVHYDGISPGAYRVVLTDPNSNISRLHLDLASGREWKYSFPVTGERKLFVAVRDAKGDPLAFDPIVMITGQERSGIFVMRTNWIQEAGRFPFQGITADSLQVWALDREGTTLSTKDVVFGSAPTLDVELRVGAKPLRVHVVDSEGNFLPGTWVTLRSTDGREIYCVDDTNAQGWAELQSSHQGAALVDLSHGIAGRRQGIPIDASAEELELVLEATGSLELRIRDGDVPLAGVSASIETSGGVLLSDTRATDEGGLVRFEPLGEGTYRVGLRRMDCWTVLHDQVLGEDEHSSVTIQMRRLGDLELTLLDGNGLPLAGLAVALRSDEFDLGLETWLREKKIQAPGGLTTDVKGRIRVTGLPRGPYSWSVFLDDQVHSGAFELEPAKLNTPSARLVR